MIAGVADTHTALWFLFGDARLSAPAKAFIETAAAQSHKIALSPITLAEIVYLLEKSRLPITAFDDLRAALANSNHGFEEAPFTADIVDAMRSVPRHAVPDMPDRIISATAIYLNVPVISRDSRIRVSGVSTIW